MYWLVDYNSNMIVTEDAGVLLNDALELDGIDGDNLKNNWKT